MFDTIITNAYILDGSGAQSYFSDLAIRDGKIARIAPGLSGSRHVIDAHGLTLTPGWIDSHSHSDNALLSYPDMREKVEQGITLSVAGHCGTSPIPGQWPKADALGSGTALLVGHNTLRRAVMGSENRDPEPHELAQMEALLEQGLREGAIGMSLGLYYRPGCYAKQEELLRLAEITARHQGILTAHIRNEGDQLLESVAELIQIATASGCTTVLSHHKAAGKENWGKVTETLSMIDQANREGADIYLDVYPYTASATSLIARFLPRQFHPPGITDAPQLLQDPQIRERIRQWGHSKWGGDLSWTLVNSCPSHPQYQGLNLNQIAQLRGQSDPFETVFDLLLENRGKLYGYFFMMCPEDMEQILQHPRAMIGTDSSVAKGLSLYHPRLRGTFPRVLGRYVREKGLVSLPEMIRRMTSLPAHVYRLRGKGLIAQGMDADICIFDPEQIIDRADYKNCDAPNEGLHYVLINGKTVLENGQYNGIRAAKIYVPQISI